MVAARQHVHVQWKTSCPAWRPAFVIRFTSV